MLTFSYAVVIAGCQVVRVLTSMSRRNLARKPMIQYAYTRTYCAYSTVQYSTVEHVWYSRVYQRQSILKAGAAENDHIQLTIAKPNYSYPN